MVPDVFDETEIEAQGIMLLVALINGTRLLPVIVSRDG